jgi:ribA/ribD-fused uncharacterized protein
MITNIGLPLFSSTIECAQHLGPYVPHKTRPIIAKIFHASDKDTILKSSHMIKQRCKVFVTEDFPDEIEQVRKVLEPIAKAAKALDTPGKPLKAHIIVDKLILNKQQYTISNLNNLPPQLQPKTIFTPTKGNITAFYTKNSPLSNHFPCSFNSNNRNYNCVEQYYCESMAKHFGDKHTAEAIMKEANPARIKQLAKNISGFNINSWKNTSLDIMKTGLFLKFDQNPELCKYLLNTGSTKLVEASPHDTFWGAGVSLWNANIWKYETWADKGKNKLGQLLEEIRRDFVRQKNTTV